MKKLLASVLAVLMLLSVAAVATAAEATIPLYVSDLDIPELQPLPTIYTKFDDENETTTLWSSLKLDWVNVNAYVNGGGYNQQVALQLDEGGTSATYSNRGMKRQVGVWWTGGDGQYSHDMLKWWHSVGTMSETEALKQIAAEYSEKGYSSTDIGIEQVTEVDTDMYKFYVNVNGKDKYVGYYDYDRAASDELNEQNAKNVLNYLVETEGYNADALSYKRETTYKPVTFDGQTYFYNVYLKPDTFTWWWRGVSGDDAYYVGIGTQTSVHGRDGNCHIVYAWGPNDLFNSDMECDGTTVTWQKNGNNGAWYPATVSANYKNNFVTNITAHYSANVDQSLEGYTITYNDKGVVYTVDYNPYGTMEVAKAVDLNGVEFKSAGSSTSFDWVNTATSKFMRNFSLLPLSDLKVILK